jgi:8-oxo-dGTP pyrophosphatase MutT (NUDIX family)
MNDFSPRRSRSRAAVVRPRDAASLILLRSGGGGRLDVLIGRRPLSVRFMPGVYVFPGGAIDRSDRGGWTVETGAGSLAPRLLPAARAALRETWEEVGVLFGAPGAAAASGRHAIERAYRERRLIATLDRLAYVGRAITPPHSFRRFNTRFFLGDGADVHGDPAASEELEDAGWHAVTPALIDAFRDVTRFMLERAIALRSGTVDGAPPPLFHWAGKGRRIGVCREGIAVR